LVPPFTTCRTDYYLDGGSIGIRLVDSKGQAEEFALPVSGTYWHTYPKLFVGAMYAGQPGAVEIPFSKDTRRMLVSWIEAYHGPGDNSGLALLDLRGSPLDCARFSSKAAANLLP
jgi:hypothetical protein